MTSDSCGGWEQEGSGTIVLKNNDKSRQADLLLLSGEPLREPVVASGTWVFSSWNEVSVSKVVFRVLKGPS